VYIHGFHIRLVISTYQIVLTTHQIIFTSHQIVFSFTSIYRHFFHFKIFTLKTCIVLFILLSCVEFQFILLFIYIFLKKIYFFLFLLNLVVKDIDAFMRVAVAVLACPCHDSIGLKKGEYGGKKVCSRSKIACSSTTIGVRWKPTLSITTIGCWKYCSSQESRVRCRNCLKYSALPFPSRIFQFKKTSIKKGFVTPPTTNCVWI
jgi:hypothetical protein